MFLRNYDNIMLLLSLHPIDSKGDKPKFSDSNAVGGTSIFGDGHLNVRKANGSIASFLTGFSSSSSAYSNLPNWMSKANICLGTGSSEVTYDDFKLSGNVIDNNKLTYISKQDSWNENTKSWKRSATYTYTNSEATDIVINEWGMYIYDQAYSSMSTFNTSSSNFVLLFREVLSAPITIAAGTTGTLTFAIDLPMPNHP